MIDVEKTVESEYFVIFSGFTHLKIAAKHETYCNELNTYVLTFFNIYSSGNLVIEHSHGL